MAKPQMATGQESPTHRGTHMEAVMNHVNSEHAKAHGKDLQTKANAIDQAKQVARGERKASETGNL
jgi:hypothetical protein